MASRTPMRQDMTLEEFLELPDNRYLEYIDGRIEEKVSPQTKHSLLTAEFVGRLNGWSRPARLGYAFPELRCTFAGLSIVPDVVFLLKEHIARDARGEPRNEIRRPPDLHIEIISTRQGTKLARTNLRHSMANGCVVGWLVNPERRVRTIDVYRPGRRSERLAPDGVLAGEPVLPGFRLSVAEVLGWLALDL
jgi:Uma2 family endonuclease